MITLPFLLLRQRIQTELTEVKEVAFYTGQDTTKGGLKIAPGVYVKFMDIIPRSLGEGIQEAEIEFELILLSDCLKEGDDRIYDGNELTHLAIADKLHKNISGYGARLSDYTDFAATLDTPLDYLVLGTCDRVGYSHTHDNKAIMKTTQRFKTYLKDRTGMKRYTKVAATLEILALEFNL